MKNSKRSPVCPELSMLECEVLTYVAHGLSNKEIARSMHSTICAIDAHIMRMRSKLGLECRVQMAVYALKSGLVRLDDVDLESIQRRRRMVG